MKVREGNFELLRCLAMIFIIIGHLINVVITQSNKDLLSISLFNIVYIFTLCGVNLFFMLSGYFQIKYTRKKIIRFILNVYLYSGIITVLGVFFGQISDIKNAIKILINPLGNYWFLGVYVVLMFFSPILNKIADSLDIKTFVHKGLVVVILFSIVNLYIYAHFELTGGQHFLWSIILYMIGFGLRKYKKMSIFERPRSFWVLLYIVSTLLCFVTYNFFNIFLDRSDIAARLYWNNCIFIVINAICLMKIFEKTKVGPKLSKLSIFAGAHTFGIYILHSSNWMATAFRNPPLYMAQKFIPMPGIPFFILMYALVVFFVCLVVDKAKEKITEPFLRWITEKVYRSSEKVILKIDKMIGVK